MLAAYQQKTTTYFTHVRRDIVSLLPANPEQKVLEIGAGAGNTILYLKQAGLAKEVMGVELMRLADSGQEHELIDRFQVADISCEDIDADKSYFDVIICADVLEHLEDPWSCLKRIVEHLKPGGMMIFSIPNFRDWKTLAKIIFRADFAYSNDGVLDKTHLRFFCRKNIVQLVNSAALEVIKMKPNFLLTEVTTGKKRRWLNRITLGLFRDFLTVQYLVTAKKMTR